MSQAMYDPQMQAIDRRRQLSQMLMQQATAGNRNFSTPGSVYGSIAQSLAGAFGTYMSDRQAGQLDASRRDEMQQFMQQAMGGGGGAPQAPQAPPQSVTRGAIGASRPVSGDYMTRLVADESNGDPTARNPRSSATGATQFIDSTWLQFAQANPERFQGMSRDQILAARNDPNLSREGADWYRRENLGALSQQGLPANDGTAALAHRFGPNGAASLLRADPNAPIDGVVGPQVMRANPDLAGRTVGDVTGRYAQRFGGGGGQDATPAGVQQPPAPQMPRNAWGPALAASQSQNPYIQRMAPVLGQMAGREQTARPTIQMVGPEGPGIYERQADGSTRYLGGLPEGAPRSPERFQQDRELAQAGRTQVNVPVNTERGFYGELAQRGGQRIDALQQQATQGAEAIRTAQRVQGLLQSGAITGTGAGLRESVERAFASAGLVDGQRVANTGQLMAELAGATLAAAGGLSGPTSDRDILFLREAAGGRLELTAETISRIAQLSADRAGRVLDQYNSVAEGLTNDPQVPEPMRRLYRPIERPIMDARPEQRQPGMQPGAQGPQPPQSSGRRPPEPGAVEDGYRYLGGNPANPRSWERVQ